MRTHEKKEKGKTLHFPEECPINSCLPCYSTFPGKIIVGRCLNYLPETNKCNSWAAREKDKTTKKCPMCCLVDLYPNESICAGCSQSISNDSETAWVK